MSGFSADARRVVRAAVEHARRRDARLVDDLDLLAGLLADPSTAAAGVLGELGLSRADVDELERARDADDRRAGLSQADVDAVAALGVDVQALVDRAEQTWGEGALRPPTGRAGRAGRVRFAPDARAFFARSMRASRELGDRQLRDEHLVLGLLAGRTPLVERLRERGVDWSGARAAIQARRAPTV